MPDRQPGLGRPERLVAPRVLAAEALASACLVAGIAAAGLSLAPLDASPALSALLRTAAVGTLLVTVLSTFGDAQVHPLLTIGSLAAQRVAPGAALRRLAAQALGGFAGAAAVHLLGNLPAESPLVLGAGTLVREGFLAFLLVLTATGASSHARPWSVPAAVGAVSGLAYWVSGSTSAVHPLTLLFRDGCGGWRGPAAQVVGALLAAYLSRWLFGGYRPADRT